jgi:hypothetical protein
MPCTAAEQTFVEHRCNEEKEVWSESHTKTTCQIDNGWDQIMALDTL